eukprot:TRINITY_DN8350_c0_g1_i3.p1 TRINITY_DN8350_c0_g1~~TRINITY_DN8350_c0_g1_i3.p1  ORF type:complete len:483 (-),score=146.72 TRINITY_DN8350_c0_g1_i3:880-2328(-)
MFKDETQGLPVLNRNGQSTCREEDLAEMLAVRLAEDQESLPDGASESLELCIEDSPTQPQSPDKTNDVKVLGTVFTAGTTNYSGGETSTITADEDRINAARKSPPIVLKRAQTVSTQDFRLQRQMSLSPKNSSPWDEWWNKKREHNYQLQYAAETGKVEKIEQLLDKSQLDDLVADVNAQGLDDFTALHFAVMEGHYEAVKALLSHSPDVEAVTRLLKTPLHMACSRGNLHIIQALANAGADINVQDNDGNTPCHILASLGLVEALVWLLEQRPNLGVKNVYGETAIETSANVEVRKMFEKCVGVDKRGSYSRTVMDGVLLHNNRADVVKSFMFRAQLMGQTVDRRDEKEREEVKVESRPVQRPNSRVVKILQVVEKIKSSPETSPQPSKEAEEATIEDFELLNLIGKGAFGRVYLVKHKKTEKLYAMKALDKKRVMTQNILRYTRTERDVLCVTKHPFIVGLHFAFQNSEKLFMVMQYCPG